MQTLIFPLRQGKYQKRGVVIPSRATRLYVEMKFRSLNYYVGGGEVLPAGVNITVASGVKGLCASS